MKYGEDNLFLWEYMCHVRKAVYVDIKLYFYRPNVFSATNQVTYRLTDSIKSVEMAYSYMRKNNYPKISEFTEYVYPRMMLLSASGFAKNGKKDFYEQLLLSYPVRKNMIRLAGKNGFLLSAASFVLFINPWMYYYFVRLFSLAEKFVFYQKGKYEL